MGDRITHCSQFVCLSNHNSSTKRTSFDTDYSTQCNLSQCAAMERTSNYTDSGRSPGTSKNRHCQQDHTPIACLPLPVPRLLLMPKSRAVSFHDVVDDVSGRQWRPIETASLAFISFVNSSVKYLLGCISRLLHAVCICRTAFHGLRDLSLICYARRLCSILILLCIFLVYGHVR